MNIRKMRAAGTKVRQAVRWQSAIASILLRIEREETNATTRIERINAKRDERVGKLKARLEGFAGKLLGFFESERENLPATPSGTAVRTSAGKCEWYPGAGSIEVTDEEAAIAALETLKLEGALRRKVELNKEYLLEHAELVERIPGIAIAQKPKVVLSFSGTRARVELPGKSSLWNVIFPRRKK